MDTTDRRRALRVSATHRRDLPAGLRDVSLGGFSLELPELLPIGTVRDFDLRTRRSKLVLRSRVAHSTPVHKRNGRDVFVTGLQFVADVTPAQSALRRTA